MPLVADQVEEETCLVDRTVAAEELAWGSRGEAPNPPHNLELHNQFHNSHFLVGILAHSSDNRLESMAETMGEVVVDLASFSVEVALKNLRPSWTWEAAEVDTWVEVLEVVAVRWVEEESSSSGLGASALEEEHLRKAGEADLLEIMGFELRVTFKNFKMRKTVCFKLCLYLSAADPWRSPLLSFLNA